MKYPKFKSYKKRPRGVKELSAERQGFSVTFDSVILGPNGAPVKLSELSTGYPTFYIYKTMVIAHRFVWHCFYGPINPDKVIDHIDGNRMNFKIENLREVTHRENSNNRLKGKSWRDLL